MVAVPGQHLFAARPLPPEGAGERFGPGAADRVDRGGVELDAEVGEEIGKEPGHAVDVVLHRRFDMKAELVAQRPQRIEAAVHLLDIEQRRHVVLHCRRYRCGLARASGGSGRSRPCWPAQVPEERAGGLDSPAILRFGRIGVGRLDQVERLADELAVLAQRQLLIVGEADIGVGVVADVDRLDLAHRACPRRPTGSRSRRASRRAGRR